MFCKLVCYCCLADRAALDGQNRVCSDWNYWQGGEVARNVLAAGQPVRGVVRDIGKGETWAKWGCELVEADINNAAALTSAFKGVYGVFLFVPTTSDPP